MHPNLHIFLGKNFSSMAKQQQEHKGSMKELAKEPLGWQISSIQKYGYLILDLTQSWQTKITPSYVYINILTTLPASVKQCGLIAVQHLVPKGCSIFNLIQAPLQLDLQFREATMSLLSLLFAAAGLSLSKCNLCKGWQRVEKGTNETGACRQLSFPPPSRPLFFFSLCKDI